MVSVDLMQKEVFDHMLETRGEKYKWFLRGLKTFKYLSMSLTKGSFLESYYTYMRYIDDVVDGDAPIPKGYENAVQYVEDKINFLKIKQNPIDSADYLFLKCIELGYKFGQDFTSESEDILNSMLFDANRYGQNIIFSKNELERHFHLLDIRGTIKATLKVFGEDPNKYNALEPLGVATRIFYNLRDYKEDINAGLINIPQEEVQRLGINPKDLENILSPGVNQWFIEESQKGMKLLQEHEKNLKKTPFKLLSKATLPIVYAKPAEKYFAQVLLG